MSYWYYVIYFIILFRSVKKSVDVSPNNGSSKIAKDHSIDIDHRKYFEYDFLSQIVGLWWAQKFHKAIHHPTSLSLSRVKSCNSQTDLLILMGWRISYVQDRNNESSSGMMVIVDWNYFLVFFLYFFDSMHEVGVWVGNAVGKIDVLIIFVELKSPGKTFFNGRFLTILLIPEFFVLEFYISTFLLPYFLGWSEAIWFHTWVVEKSTFLEINQIKSYFFFVIEVGNFEVEPSCMSFGVAIDSHEQIIFQRVDQNS